MSDQQQRPLKTCPCCGWDATLINRQPEGTVEILGPGDFQVACARWRNELASEGEPCSITTGSYPTAEEAIAVWERRCR